MSYRLFLIKGIRSINGEKPKCCLYVSPIIKLNDENYCFCVAKGPAHIKHFIPLINNSFKLNISESQVYASEINSRYTNKNGKFYVYNNVTKTGFYEFFFKSVIPNSKIRFEQCYCEIRCKYVRTYLALLPLFPTLNLKTTTTKEDIPAVYVTNISRSISNKEFPIKFKELSGEKSGIQNILYDSKISQGNGFNRFFIIEFDTIENREIFIDKVQNFNLDGRYIDIRRFVEDNESNRMKQLTIQVDGIKMNPSKALKIFEEFGKVWSLSINSEKGIANVIYYQRYPTTLFFEQNNSNLYLNSRFLFTTFILFNLKPDITADDIYSYLPIKARPDNIDIYSDHKQQQCSFAVLNFSKDTMENLDYTDIFLSSNDGGPIGSLIPFGYVDIANGIRERTKIYRDAVFKAMNKSNNSVIRPNLIKIQNIESVTMNQILEFLKKNGIIKITFLYRYIPTPKEDNKNENKNENESENNNATNIDRNSNLIDDVDDERIEMESGIDCSDEDECIIVAFSNFGEGPVDLSSLDKETVNEKRLKVTEYVNAYKIIKNIKFPAMED